MEALLGEKLLNKSEEVSTSVALKADVIGLYFSAHWCGPCRNFTPQLAATYAALKAEGKSFEIVFVSSDQDAAAFTDYYGKEMPWLALPFEDRERKTKLSTKYKVNGIPTLVLLKGNGELITTGGRAAVANPADYPFIPPTAKEVLSKAPLVNNKGEKVTLESITAAGKYIALYFSAHWCPPCKGFTPKLAAAYKQLAAASTSPGLEVIFVSSDRDEEGFKEYFAEMPWLALPFDDRDGKGKLSGIFEVQGIPTLVLLDSEMKVVNADTRGAVEAGRAFPWLPPDVMDLEEDGGAINESPAVIVLMEKAETQWDAVDAALLELAKAQKAALAAAAADDETEKVAFFTAREIGGGITDQVRQLFSLGKPGKEPQAVLTNFPAGGKYHVIEGAVSAASLKKALDDFKAGSLAFKSLGGGEDD